MTNEELIVAIKEELVMRELLSCVTDAEWRTIWDRSGAHRDVGVADVGLSFVGIRQVLRSLAGRRGEQT